MKRFFFLGSLKLSNSFHLAGNRRPILEKTFQSLIFNFKRINKNFTVKFGNNFKTKNR